LRAEPVLTNFPKHNSFGTISKTRLGLKYTVRLDQHFPFHFILTDLGLSLAWLKMLLIIFFVIINFFLQQIVRLLRFEDKNINNK